MDALTKLPVVKAIQLQNRGYDSAEFGYYSLVGRVTELVCVPSSPYLTVMSALVREAQRLREPVVWIATREVMFFPPDMAANGVDLQALPVVWVPTSRAAVRAAEYLMRSNTFGLLVLDLPPQSLIEQGKIGKLARLADLRGSAVVFITKHSRGTQFTLGSMVSLRCEVHRERVEENRYHCVVRVVKDKRRPPGWRHAEECHGPDGLR
jgi:recombination protein RecA